MFEVFMCDSNEPSVQKHEVFQDIRCIFISNILQYTNSYLTPKLSVVQYKNLLWRIDDYGAEP